MYSTNLLERSNQMMTIWQEMQRQSGSRSSTKPKKIRMPRVVPRQLTARTTRMMKMVTTAMLKEYHVNKLDMII